MASPSSATNSTGGMPAGKKKKTRKPYKITRPREKWAADEHERFLHALLRLGRDWKRIEQLVATKTATHAQKFFLKAQKLGLTAALPPPQPRRGAVLSQLAAARSHPDADGYGHGNAAVGMDIAPAAPAWPLMPATSPPPPPMSSTGFAAQFGAQQQQSADWPSCSTGPTTTEAGWGAGDDAVLQEDDDDSFQLLLPAAVTRFVGDVFGAGVPRPVEAQLQRLQGVDPVVVDTILLVLSNLQDNLFD